MPSVRLADSRDAESVSTLLVAFRDHLGYGWPSENAFLAGVERLLEDPSTDYLLGFADPDSPPAGVAQLRYRHGLWRAGGDCLLEDLFVTDAARGQGLGRALVQATLDRARERGCRRVELDANERNEAAVRLYESFGFSSTSESYDGGRDLYFRVHLD